MNDSHISVILATILTTLTAWLGGWDIALKLLVFLMVGDYFTGILRALRARKTNSTSLDSEVMFWGGIRKAIILGVIILATFFDEFVGNGAPIFRTGAIYFYVGREGLSLIENLGQLNVYVPEFLRSRLNQLNKDNGNLNKKGDQDE